MPSLATIALTLTAALTLTSCLTLYGADFDYPPTPAQPDGSSVVARDRGWDDDDPFRSRQLVIDAPDLSRTDVMGFYRQHYADGWRAVHDEDGLCLLDESNEKYVQILNVGTYAGGRVDHAPHRYLVVLSRRFVGGEDDEDTCDLPFFWIASDLIS